MKFKIKVSGGMMRGFESSLICIPKDLRASLGLNVGEYIRLRAKKDGQVKLKVEKAYTKDVDSDSNAAYVESVIFDLLDLEDLVKEDAQIEVIDNITLGSDPEYFLIDRTNGRIIHPQRFFTKFGPVGHDGMLAEIRPMPHTSERQVTDNILYLLRKAKGIVNQNPLANDTGFMAVSHYQSCTAGFHLHYGIPRVLLENTVMNKDILRQVVRVMDYYVGVPSIIPEGVEDSGRRCAPFVTYGKVGDHRTDHRTLEYRVPGGTLLRHPMLTQGLIGLGAVVLEDILSRLNVSTDGFKRVVTPEDMNSIYPDVPSSEDLFKTVCVPHTIEAERCLDKIYRDVQQMIGYNKRSGSIEGFFDCINKKYSSFIDDNWDLNIQGVEQHA